MSIRLNSITHAISPYNYIVKLFSNLLHEKERKGGMVMDPIDAILASTETLAVKFLVLV